MHIFEYSNKDWKESVGFLVTISVLLASPLIILPGVLLSPTFSFQSWLKITLIVLVSVVALVVLYLLARLLYKSYLIVTGQEWKSGNREWALTCVNKITRQDKLMKVAIKGIESARVAAIARITDQGFLARVAINDPESRPRMAAVEKITDQGFLTRVAINAPDNQTRAWAVVQITDQGFLEQVAMNAPDNQTCYQAVVQITDQDCLEQVAMNAPYSLARGQAVKQITGQEFLKQVAMNDPESWPRMAAVEKITDREWLKKVAINIFNNWDRVRVIEHFLEGGMDQEVLEALVSTLAGILNTGNTWDREKCAGYLQSIYNQHAGSIREEILALEGTLVREGTKHSDYHDDGTILWNGTRMDEHVDIPAIPPVCLHIKRS
jgi:hypothetical protein